MVDAGGRLELFEAKWTELPDISDAVNLDFVRDVVGKSRVTGGVLVARTLNSFPFSNGFRALPANELEDLQIFKVSLAMIVARKELRVEQPLRNG
jgi:hypothetical protein